MDTCDLHDFIVDQDKLISLGIYKSCWLDYTKEKVLCKFVWKRYTFIQMDGLSHLVKQYKLKVFYASYYVVVCSRIGDEASGLSW